MTRQWIRVISGKCAGSIGYILWDNGLAAWIVFPGAPYPFDRAFKQSRTFMRLTETECNALELTRPAEN